jgi:hypothetical protein
MVTRVQYAFTSLQLAVHILLCVAAMILLYFRRNVEPIKSRAPLALASLIPMNLITVLLIDFTSVYLRDFYCILRPFQDFSFTSLAFALSVQRGLFTVFKFRIAHENLRKLQRGDFSSQENLLRKGDARDRSADEWNFSKHREWAEGKRVTFTVIGTYIVTIIPCFFFIGGNEPFEECWFIYKRAYYVFFYLFRCMVFLLVCIFAYLLRKEKLDSFWIFNELKYSAIVSGVVYSGFLLIGFLFPDQVWVSIFLTILLLSSLIVLEVIYPAFLSFKSERFDKSTTQLESSGFEQILENADMGSAFVSFLQTEFSLENWLFREAVLAYKKEFQGVSKDDAATTRAHLKQLADKINQAFILESGETQVNVSSDTSLKVQLTIGRWNTCGMEEIGAVFDGALKEILKLLKDDSYRRFVRSPQFQQANMKIKQQHMEIVALKQAEL